MRLRNVVATAAVSAALIAGSVAGPLAAGTAHAEDTFLGILPEPALRGANDVGCNPSAHKPNPVVLVHGLGATASENWFAFAPYLAERGYCVFAKTYGMDPRYPGRGGLTSMQESAAELASFVDEVLAATGARKVDLVGHSEGALMPRHYLKFLGGAAKVEHFVGWAGPNHGTTFGGLAPYRTVFPGFDAGMGQFCGSCPQFMIGSDFLTALNAGDETIGKVKYTVLITRYDQLVTPIETSYLRGNNVTNILIQDVNPSTYADHAGMAADPTTFELTLAGLGR